MAYDLFAKFRESVENHPNAIAGQIKENNVYKTYTYSRLYELSLKVSAFLNREGVSRQERVAILLENSPLWPALYFGIIACGRTAVPIDTKLTPYEVNNILRDSQARILFTSDELYLPLRGLLKNILSFKKALLCPFEEVFSLNADSAAKACPQNKADDLASLLYTSGTTASPKGVMLTHRNFCSNFEGIARLKIINPADNIVSLLPLHHSYPFMITVVVPLLTGSKVTFLNSLKAEDLMNCLSQTRATILVGVPQLYQLLHKAIMEKIKRQGLLFSLLKITAIARRLFGLNLNKLILKKLHRRFGKSLRLFACGGARLDPQAAKDLSLLGFTVLEGYGLTETSPVVTFNPLKRVKPGSVGIPIPDVSLRINNPDPKGVGEVLIQGPNVMKGYYKKPQETSGVLKDGWFYSGDLGYLDKDGYLFLTGRCKEVIVLSSGKNIYPEEIEAHYLKSPYIKELCVLEWSSGGIPCLHAVVFPNIEFFRKTKEMNIQGKIRWILENLSKELPSYKRIMGFTVAKEELPKTRLGKLKRYEIKARYLSESAQEGQHPPQPKEVALSRTGLENRIIEFLSAELKAKVSLDSHLELDLGIDSLRRVELAMALEKMLNINIPDSQLAEVFTVKELAAKIKGILGQGAQTPAGPDEPGSWSRIIRQPPEQEVLDKINLHPAIADKILTFLILNFIRLLFKIFWRLKIEGSQNLPQDKPFIICPNHSSYLDGFIVAASADLGLALNLFFLGYSGYFRHPLVRWAIKSARLIAIDPALNLTEAMQASAFVLRNNKSLCLFPEGERSIDDKVKGFKKGVGILVKETDCLVVPCYISGSHQAWMRGERFPRPYPIKITIGKPCSKDELRESGQKYRPQDDYEAITLGLKEKVEGLKNGECIRD